MIGLQISLFFVVVLLAYTRYSTTLEGELVERRVTIWFVSPQILDSFKRSVLRAGPGLN